MKQILVYLTFGFLIIWWYGVFQSKSFAQMPEAICGNGIVETDEQCDDGNDLNEDGCDINCYIEQAIPTCPNPIVTPEPECWNGIVEWDEWCDDCNTDEFDGCESTCVLNLRIQTVAAPTQICGNGTVEWLEGCDDGNLVGFDGCDIFCSNTTIQYVSDDGAPAWTVQWFLPCDYGFLIEPEVCLTCPDWMYVWTGEHGNTTCLQCPTWTINYQNLFYDNWFVGPTPTQCMQCDPEFAIPNAAQNKCLVCPFGTIVSGGECVPCDKSNMGYCESMWWRAGTNIALHVLEYCPVWIASDRSGCIPCPEWQGNFGTECWVCPQGTVLETYRAPTDHCAECPAWTYQTGNQCLECNEWSISSTWWSSCYQCDPEISWSNESQTECIYCDPWYFATGGHCEACVEGDMNCGGFCLELFSPTEEEFGLFCSDYYDLSYPEGTFCPEGSYYAGIACIPCPEWTTSLAGQSECYACPPGTEGSFARCYPCANWLVSETSWSLDCHTCEPGTVPNDTQTACIISVQWWGGYGLGHTLALHQWLISLFQLLSKK